MTGGNILIKNCPMDCLEALVAKLREAGTVIEPETGGVRVIGKWPIKSVDVKTLPYPGFPTDMQAQIMAMMTISGGLSVIRETVFENRFMHVGELRRMGADISVDGRCAIIRGVEHLGGAPLMATDLRASASLVLAGLVAAGKTEISRIYHLDRGYDGLEKKLAALGAAEGYWKSALRSCSTTGSTSSFSQETESKAHCLCWLRLSRAKTCRRFTTG